MSSVFPPRPAPVVPVQGGDLDYPVARIFCIGRNYAAHAAEMGNAVDRDTPFFFTKSLHAVSTDTVMPYPPGTEDLHYEGELVVALGGFGAQVEPENAHKLIFGYACGLDMTRRDLQAAAKDKRRPWDAAKDFEHSAVLGPITPADRAEIDGASLRLNVNGELRQHAPLADMIFPIPELIAYLSTLYTLSPGDLIMTGTPAGVGAVTAGDTITCAVGALPPVTVTIV